MGMGIGDWGLGIGDWAQSPIPNPHINLKLNYFNFLIIKKYNLSLLHNINIFILIAIMNKFYFYIILFFFIFSIGIRRNPIIFIFFVINKFS